MKKFLWLSTVAVFVLLGAACSKPASQTNTNTTTNIPVNSTNSITTGTFVTNATVENTNSVTASNTEENTSTSGLLALPLPQRASDAAATLSSPMKVPMTDGAGYFIVGQPLGQNSKLTKKIIFSLPGHGTTAEKDYDAWKSQITDNDYTLASLNWWDGSGETPQDYMTPLEVLNEMTRYLVEQGYDSSDLVVLEGFSRGSANTYAVKSYDVINQTNVIDAVISASGKYQSDFPLAPGAITTPNLFEGVPWILVCGGKDDNPTRDGCPGMTETKTWLVGEGADLLGLLEDPNGGHGAFHASPLKLVDQALALLDQQLR